MLEDTELQIVDEREATENAAIVRVDALRNYRETVLQFGGDPDALLRRARIDPAVLDNRNAVISFRMMVYLLEHTAEKLNCADFGMRLAGMQGGAKVLGPLEVVMKNSRTVGEAFKYCADHTQAYTTAAQICLEEIKADSRNFMRFEILLSRVPHQRQSVEQALLLTHHAAQDISGGRARAREVWFVHQPLADAATYRAHFDCVVRFNQSSNGLFFSNADLDQAISDTDPQLYELASYFIDSRFPAHQKPISSRVRSLVGRLLNAGECTHEKVAAALGLHSRTLQRRLRAEGHCFEAIKDEVRRDVAMRYLRQSDIPLVRVAELLGYSETSVLSRSCYRWFAASPRELRSELAT